MNTLDDPDADLAVLRAGSPDPDEVLGIQVNVDYSIKTTMHEFAGINCQSTVPDSNRSRSAGIVYQKCLVRPQFDLQLFTA